MVAINYHLTKSYRLMLSCFFLAPPAAAALLAMGMAAAEDSSVSMSSDKAWSSTASSFSPCSFFSIRDDMAR